MRKRSCPEDCRYYDRSTRFCGYCIKDILDEMEEKRNGKGKKQKTDIEQAGGIWVRYGKEGAAAYDG